jgi:integrase/recombinase XerD
MTVPTEPGAIPGLFPLPTDQEAGMTLECWVATHAAPWTGVQYRCFLRRFQVFRRAVPDLPFGAQVQRWLDTMPVSQGVAARSALKHAYGRRACVWESLELRRYRRNEARLMAGLLGPDERAKLRAACLSPRELAIVECCWTLRRFEVAALRWGDLDLTRGVVYVRLGKGRKASWTLLPSSTRDALMRWCEAAGAPPAEAPVFPIEPGRPGLPGSGGHPAKIGQPLTPGGIGKIVQILLTRAGLWTRGMGAAHRFRRSFATEYLRANRSDVLGLQQLMRHDDVATTQRYVFFTREDLAARLDQITL